MTAAITRDQGESGALLVYAHMGANLWGASPLRVNLRVLPAEASLAQGAGAPVIEDS